MFIFSLLYEDVSNELRYKVWDFNTVTAADFTVEVIIPEQAWHNWKDKQEGLTNPGDFKKELMKEII